MKYLLAKLANWLINAQQEQEAEQVKDLYEEDWHEEAVKEFGADPISEEDYVAQNFEQENTSAIANEIFKENNFKTVIGEQYLGAGVYGQVYRGIYNGKPAAAKIIIKRGRLGGGLEEVDVWKKIKNASESFPSELKKHLPEIYLLKKGECNGSPYALIVMEELRPLSKNLEQIINTCGSYYKRNMERLLKDEDYLYDLSKRITNQLLSQYSPFKYRLREITPEQIFKFIYEITSYFDKTVYKVNDFDDINLINRGNLVHDLTKKIKEAYNLDSDAALRLDSELYSATDYLSYPGGMPSDLDDLKKDQSWLMMPETKQYFEMLKLMDNYGIMFDDQHSGNIMMGNDDNLKLIDVGGYHVV